MLVLAATALAMWCALLVVPWQPWRAIPVLDSDASLGSEPVSDVTALVPARNETAVIETSVQAATSQVARVIVIDDESADATPHLAADSGAQVVQGEPLPDGWSGKVWALEQGRREVETAYVLLLDADIALAPGIVATLVATMKRDGIAFASLVPEPSLARFWDKLLMPAFVYFFAILYPFRLSNSERSRVAAASGGCVALERRALDTIGGFGAIKGALIDDCALASAVKRAGFTTWVGYTRSARSVRGYEGLAGIWAMVERSAYTQLRYSPAWLLACTLLMLVAFWVPLLAAVDPDPWTRLLGLAALAAMVASYVPTLRLYNVSTAWALPLLLTATLFLAMTWTSALRYYRRERARWKGRVYEVGP